MTGTKIVKLKLEGGGAADRLPQLREPSRPVEVDELVSLYDKVIVPENETWNVGKYYEGYLAETNGMDTNPKQLQEVLDRLEENYGQERDYSEKAGSLLTALMQNSHHKLFELKSELPLSRLGFRLSGRKSVSISGDVGSDVGREMENGFITVNGHSGDELGMEMKGGRIVVEKTAKDRAGYKMAGGTIHVKGEVNEEAGRLMTAGTIVIEKNAGVLTGDGMEGGSIHVKGDATEKTGFMMKGGSILVDGNAGPDTGCMMKGGFIHVKGNAYQQTGPLAEGGKIIIDKWGMSGGGIKEGCELWINGKKENP
ncbi:MAG: hypothetical protein V1921_06245 [Candidatus Altiarchaeota archaeon]